MSTRTLQFLGAGVGTVDSNITANFNGNVVFTGNVVASGGNGIALSNTNILFSCNVDLALNGNIPFSLTVNSGTVTLGSVLSNYNKSHFNSGDINGVFYANLATYTGNIYQANATNVTPISVGSNEFLPVNNDLTVDVNWREVYINGNLVPTQSTPAGQWVYVVQANETLTCNINVLAGVV